MVGTVQYARLAPMKHASIYFFLARIDGRLASPVFAELLPRVREFRHTGLDVFFQHIRDKYFTILRAHKPQTKEWFPDF